MGVKLDVQKFAVDYRKGVSDRDLLAKYKISAQELLAIVKKLIKGGHISKEDYFDRNRKIDELKAIREKDFLKSLHHCPVCSHVQPIPFSTCPACGTDIAEHQEAELSGERAIEKAIEEKYAADSSVGQEGGVVEATQAPRPAMKARVTRKAPQEAVALPSREPPLVPEFLKAKIGMPLQGLSLLEGAGDVLLADAYALAEVVSADSFSALFKAKPQSKQGSPLLVKIFDPVILSETDAEEFFYKLADYQTGMVDPNILRAVATGTVGADKALVYEFLPTTLDNVLRQHEEGLSLEMMMGILPQVLNALGYSHMHRGIDGKVQRLSHLHLRLSKFLFDEDKQVAKLEDCAVWRSLVEVRGLKKHLSDEPGVDLSALAPECFVIESKFVNAFLVDIYALGVLLYRLTTGRDPFLGSNLEEYRFEHLRKFPVPPRVHRYTIPRWLDEMILKCLEKEPGQRWRSATQMELAIRKDVLQ
ncbi:MAG: hypothetical protein HY913_13625 [Desulfomonile tiedjei]|nr:hypothetical protein [Desulfomonile tiedjei]